MCLGNLPNRERAITITLHDAKDRLILGRENIRRRLSPFNIEIDFIKEKDKEMDVERSDNTREDCSSTPGKSFPAMFNVAFSIVLGVTYSHYDFFQLSIYGPKVP